MLTLLVTTECVPHPNVRNAELFGTCGRSSTWHSRARPAGAFRFVPSILTCDVVSDWCDGLSVLLNSNDAGESPSSPRRAALTVVPFAALMVGLGLLVLFGLSLPSSSAPSDDDVVSAVAALWVIGVTALVLSVLLATIGSFRLVWFTAAGIVVVMSFVGWRVTQPLDTAWLDACDYGTNSGDRCIAGDGAPPQLIRVAWPVAGALIGLLGAALSRATRRFAPTA